MQKQTADKIRLQANDDIEPLEQLTLKSILEVELRPESPSNIKQTIVEFYPFRVRVHPKKVIRTTRLLMVKSLAQTPVTWWHSEFLF